MGGKEENTVAMVMMMSMPAKVRETKKREKNTAERREMKSDP